MTLHYCSRHTSWKHKKTMYKSTRFCGEKKEFDERYYYYYYLWIGVTFNYNSIAVSVGWLWCVYVCVTYRLTGLNLNRWLNTAPYVVKKSVQNVICVGNRKSLFWNLNSGFKVNNNKLFLFYIHIYICKLHADFTFLFYFYHTWLKSLCCRANRHI